MTMIDMTPGSSFITFKDKTARTHNKANENIDRSRAIR